MEHILYWLWFTGLYGTASGRFLPLIERLGGIDKVYNSKTYPNMGCYSEKNLEKLKNKSLAWAKKIFDVCQRKNITIITYKDNNYPQALKNIFVPPVVLYTRGEIPDWENILMISIVGTRKATDYGLRVASNLSKELAQKGVTLVSGVARGIDSKVIESAVNVGAHSIMISPCGLDINYPKINEDLRTKVVNTGLMMSEYPPGTQTKAWHFKDRNRLLAGLSMGTLVVEAPGKSGSLITARYALEENRDIFVVPGQIDDRNSTGINNLLRDGAKPVFTSDDILSEYVHYKNNLKPVQNTVQGKADSSQRVFDKALDKQKESSKKQEQSFDKITKDGAEGEILKFLTENGESHIDILLRELNFTANEFQTALFLLELGGTVKRLPGNILKRVK